MRYRFALLTLATIVLSFATVKAQDETARTRDAKPRGLDVARAVQETQSGNSNASPEVMAKVKKAYTDADPPKENSLDRRLTGTWYVTVPIDDTTVFHAFHTFGSDGTFVETSSLLGSLIEGPAHGVWESRKRGALLTFEVFEFDPDGKEAGRVRVRNLIRLTDDDHFTADGVVDFIDVNGEITEGIATGTFTGQRMKVREL